MSRYFFNPITRELEYAYPRAAEIPESAFSKNSTGLYVQAAKRTSPLLIALIIVMIVVIILVLIYLGWLVFIKTADQSPAEFFAWITGR